MIPNANSKLHFIVENVEMSYTNQRLYSTFLNGAKACKMDFEHGAGCSSLMGRRRLYFTSFLSNMHEFGFHDFQSAPDYCMHWAKRENKSLDDVLVLHCLDSFEFFHYENKEKVWNYLPTMTRTNRDHAVGQSRYWIRHKKDHRDFHRSPQDINEELLGFDVGHTNVFMDGSNPKPSYRNV